MTDETVAETTTRPDAPTDEERTFGDAADDAPATDAGEQNPNLEAKQDEQGSEDAEDKPAAEVETGAAEEMKVVVSIKRNRATIGGAAAPRPTRTSRPSTTMTCPHWRRRSRR